MKTNTLLTTLTACLCAVAFTACDKKPEAAAPAVPATNTTVSSAVDAAKDAAAKAVESTKDAAAKAVETAKDATGKAVDSTKEVAGKVADSVKDTAAKATDAVKDAAAKLTDTTPSATDSVTAKFTEAVTNAKQFITDKNYQGALDELKKLSDLKLSDDQQKIVDGLKAEAQKLLSAGADSAVDAAKNLLGK